MPSPLPYDFQFKKFSEMFEYADRETPMNVTCLVIGAFTEKKVGLDKYGRGLIAKDFGVTDNENIPKTTEVVSNESGYKRVLCNDDFPKATTIVEIDPPDDDVVQQPSLAASSSAESPIKKSKTKAINE